MSLNILNSNKKINTSINKKSSRKAKILPQFSISSENKPLLDLLEIQRKSFFDFLQHGIPDELAKTAIFRETAKNSTGKQELELKFNPETYKFISPNFTPKEAILNGKTYACKVYVQATLLIRSPYNTEKATARGIFQKEPSLVKRKSNDSSVFSKFFPLPGVQKSRYSLALQDFANISKIEDVTPASQEFIDKVNRDVNFAKELKLGRQSRNLSIIPSNTDSSQLRKSKVNRSVKAFLASQLPNSAPQGPPSKASGADALLRSSVLLKGSYRLGVDIRSQAFELRHLLHKSQSLSKTKILAKHDFSFAAAPFILQNKFIEYLNGAPQKDLLLMKLGLCRRKASGLLSYANFVLCKREINFSSSFSNISNMEDVTLTSQRQDLIGSQLPLQTSKLVSKKREWTFTSVLQRSKKQRLAELNVSIDFVNQSYGVQNCDFVKRVAEAHLRQCWIPLSKTLLSKTKNTRLCVAKEENNLLGRKLGEEANLQKKAKIDELATTLFKLDTPDKLGVINGVDLSVSSCSAQPIDSVLTSFDKFLLAPLTSPMLTKGELAPYQNPCEAKLTSAISQRVFLASQRTRSKKKPHEISVASQGQALVPKQMLKLNKPFTSLGMIGSVFDSLSLASQVQRIKKQRKSTALSQLFFPKEYNASPYSVLTSHLLQSKGLHVQPAIPSFISDSIDSVRKLNNSSQLSKTKVNEYPYNVKNTRTRFEETVSVSSCSANISDVKEGKPSTTMVSSLRETINLLGLQKSGLCIPSFAKDAKQAEKHGFADPLVRSKKRRIVQSEEGVKQNILLGSKKLVVDKKKGDLSDIQVFHPWIFLGELPLMTKRGHFILNGSPRVIVNQIARCPGIYFQEKRRGVGIEQEIRVSADLIPQRGPWLRIQSDWEGRFWARLKQEGRVKYATLYEAFQEFEKEYTPPLICLLSNAYPATTSNPLLGYPEGKQSTGVKIKISTSSVFSKSENVTFQERKMKEDRQKKALIRLFKNPARYSLGKLGRSRVNERIHNSFIKSSNPTTTSINYVDNSLTNRKSVLEILYASCPYASEVSANIPSLGSYSLGSKGRDVNSAKMVVPSKKKPINSLGGAGSLLMPSFISASVIPSKAKASVKEAEEVNRAVKSISPLASQLHKSIDFVDKSSGFLRNFETLSSKSSSFISSAKGYTYNGKYGKLLSSANKALRYSVNEELMAKDLDATHTCLERLLEGQGFTDDIDNLKNRFIRTSGKLLQQQFELGLFRLNEVIMPLLGNLLPSASDSSINKVNKAVKDQLRTNIEDVNFAKELKLGFQGNLSRPSFSSLAKDCFTSQEGAVQRSAGSLSKVSPVMAQSQTLYRNVRSCDSTNNNETKLRKSHKCKEPNALRCMSSQLLTSETEFRTEESKANSKRPGDAGIRPLEKKPYTFRFVRSKASLSLSFIYPLGNNTYEIKQGLIPYFPRTRFATKNFLPLRAFTSVPQKSKETYHLDKSYQSVAEKLYASTNYVDLAKLRNNTKFSQWQIKKLESENLMYPTYSAKLKGLSLQYSKGLAKQAREFFAMQSHHQEQHVQMGSLRLAKGLPVKAKAFFPQRKPAPSQSLGDQQYKELSTKSIDLLSFNIKDVSAESIDLSYPEGVQKSIEKVSIIKNAPFRWLRTSKPINSAFREFFGSNPLSQYMDQTNPLAEITHKRRLSSMGPGGIKRETAGMEVRGIHPTHYGRVCPIETPEGKNAGLVNSPTVYGRVGNYGFLETPLYEVIENQVQTKRWAFFSAQHEEKALRGKGLATCDTGLLQFNFLAHLPIPVQTANNPLTHFQQVERYRVGYRSLSPIQTISIATALIPFLEHDDANRALMGSNMQRQAIPLLSPERPIVGTGFEPLVVIESGQALQATKLGCVFQADANSIIVYTRRSREKPFACPKGELAPYKIFDVSAKQEGGAGSLSMQSLASQRTQIKQNVLRNFRFTALPWSKALRRIFGTKDIVGSENLPFSNYREPAPPFLASQKTQSTGHPSCFALTSPSEIKDEMLAKQTLAPKQKGACCAKVLSKAELGSKTSVSSLLQRSISPYLSPITSNGLITQRQAFTSRRNKVNISNISSFVSQGVASHWVSKKLTLQDFLVRFAKQRTSFSSLAKQAIQPATYANGFLENRKSIDYVNNSKGLEFLLQYSKGLAKQYPCALLTSSFTNVKPLLRQEGVRRLSQEQREYIDSVRHISSSHDTFLLQPLKQDLQFYERSNQETCLNQRPLVQEGDWIQKGDFLADSSASHSGDLALGKNVKVAYMPWEGYNFEDAIVISDRLVSDDIYTSLHIERYDIKVSKNSQGKERITNRVPGTSNSLKHLDNFGIARTSSWVQPGDILVGKVVELKRPLSPYERLAWELASRLSPKSPEREKWLNKVWLEDISLRLPSGVCGRVINSQIISTEYASMSAAIPKEDFSQRGTQSKEQAIYPQEVHIYLAIKRKIQIGDKLAGRHGNKGIVSAILPQEDMPYLGDGSCIDMVLNPLGVPSRMNLGQIFECLLGLAGSQLGCNFRITPFDEIAGGEASRSLVFLKLYQCRLMYKQQWLFTPTFPGKSKLFDGRTGEPFENWVTVGQAYMLKLIHMVDHKIHARSTGPYSLFTRQPVRGRSRRGGQRLGEMEVWAVEGFGAAYTLQEFLTIKSDDLKARTALQKGFYKQNDVTFGKIHIAPGNPEAFKVLISELQALCLHIQM